MFKSVAVIGAGQMGKGIVQFLATKSIKVTLIDYKETNVCKASEGINKSLFKLLEKEKL